MCIISPSDLLTGGFLSFLLLLTIVYKNRVQNWLALSGLYITLLAVLILLIMFKSKIPILLHSLVYPVVAVALIFDSLGSLVPHINAVDKDPVLIRIDRVIFGVDPTVWLERLRNKYLTLMLQIAYSSYYFLPVVLGAVMLQEGKVPDFDKSLFIVLLGFYASYVGYLLVPALGPRFTVSELGGGNVVHTTISHWLYETLNRMEGMKRDAFPSAHTAVTLIILYLGYHYEKALFPILVPITIGIIFSTVYLRYHYAIDVIAGALLAVPVIYFGNRFYDLCG